MTEIHEIYQVVDIDSNIDSLLRLGLGKKNQLSLYKRVLKDPHSATMDNQNKQFLLRMFKIFRDTLFNNKAVYDKVKANLVATKANKVGAWATRGRAIREATVPSSKIDYLLRLGFDDINFLTVNRQIILNPESAINDPFKRPKLFDLFMKFRNILLLDPYNFERLKRELYLSRRSFSEWINTQDERSVLNDEIT